MKGCDIDEGFDHDDVKDLAIYAHREVKKILERNGRVNPIIFTSKGFLIIATPQEVPIDTAVEHFKLLLENAGETYAHSGIASFKDIEGEKEEEVVFTLGAKGGHDQTYYIIQPFKMENGKIVFGELKEMYQSRNQKLKEVRKMIFSSSGNSWVV